jgi:NADP-dependent 3-hydroxy acid dehydrogenase YdfG
MTDKRVWFITGAGRGTGADIAKAVLDAGHRLIATGRDTERLTQVVGSSADLLAVKLDVTRRDDADAAVRAVVERFGQFWPRRLVV